MADGGASIEQHFGPGFNEFPVVVFTQEKLWFEIEFMAEALLQRCGSWCIVQKHRGIANSGVV